MLSPLPEPESRGFSLIEVLVALVILSFSLLALAGLMVTSTKNNSFGNHMTEAATFAKDKLEELRTVKWDDLRDGSHADAQLLQGSTGINYARNWTITTSGSLKTITINVNWNDGTAHSIRLVSVLTQ